MFFWMLSGDTLTSGSLGGVRINAKRGGLFKWLDALLVTESINRMHISSCGRGHDAENDPNCGRKTDRHDD
jgi:hypothetical protein